MFYTENMVHQNVVFFIQQPLLRDGHVFALETVAKNHKHGGSGS